MKNVHTRAKRLELRRKKSIVEKEMQNSQNFKTIKCELVKLKENCYTSQVKQNILK